MSESCLSADRLAQKWHTATAARVLCYAATSIYVLIKRGNGVCMPMRFLRKHLIMMPAASYHHSQDKALQTGSLPDVISHMEMTEPN